MLIYTYLTKRRRLVLYFFLFRYLNQIQSFIVNNKNNFIRKITFFSFFHILNFYLLVKSEKKIISNLNLYKKKQKIIYKRYITQFIIIAVIIKNHLA